MFAFSATWWKFATDADAYVPAVLFLVAAYLALQSARSRPILVALLHVGAMLFHELAIFFFPVAMLCLYGRTGNRRRKDVAQYAATSSVLIAAAYWAVYRGDVLQKIFYHSPDSSFSLNPLRGIGLTLLGSLRLFFGGRWDAEPHTLWSIASVLICVGALVRINVQEHLPVRLLQLVRDRAWLAQLANSRLLLVWARRLHPVSGLLASPEHLLPPVLFAPAGFIGRPLDTPATAPQCAPADCPAGLEPHVSCVSKLASRVE
jgi:hypothetical protein